MKKTILPLFIWALACLPAMAQVPKKPDLWVLSIGVENYRDTSLNLSFSADDARSIAEAFGKQTDLYNIREIKVLTDTQATRKGIRAEFNRLGKEITDDDLFVFFYSGHGKEDYLLPHDFEMGDEEGTAVSAKYLREKLVGWECNFVMFLDACHSGSFTDLALGGRDEKDKAGPDERQERVNKAVKTIVAGFSSPDKLHFVMASSSSIKKSFECMECGHGYLTQSLLDFMEGKLIMGTSPVVADPNGDDMLSLIELEKYAKEWVRVRTQGGNPQKVVCLKRAVDDSIPLLAVQETYVQRTITETVNGVSFKMVYVEGGTFTMGCTGIQYRLSMCEKDEKPAHEVTLSSYSIGETEVTQELWRVVMENNPSYYKDCDECPVEEVSWEDVQEFIQKLNALTDRKYRLPTEAEWEYAARGGNRSRGYIYSGGDFLDEVAWYIDNSDYKTHAVKGKKANELGIYDMSGNVWEWCSDWSGDYTSGSQMNPTGPAEGSVRVARGGSWGYNPQDCRVSARDDDAPVIRSNNLGLRLASQ